MTSARKWHIFIYKESTDTYTCICSCNYIAKQKLATFIRNTHSSFKYCPVATDDVSVPNFITIKNHHTKHTSHISWSFLTKSLIVLHLPYHTKHFHCGCLCSQKCQRTWFHLLFCLFHLLLVIFYLIDQIF